MFVIVDSQTVFYAWFVGMQMIYLHTKFHMLGNNGSLVIVVKLKAKDNFLTPAMLLFYIVQKINLKFAHFLNAL
jgi:hypothetical protein